MADAEAGPFVLPAATLAEAAYFVEARMSPGVLEALLFDLERGAFDVDLDQRDYPRIRHLVRRYADLPLGFVDAAVIAGAERVLTLDLRHFGVVAREGTITILP